MKNYIYFLSFTLLFGFVAVGSGQVIGGSTTNKIVCYYASWSKYRPGKGAFTIEDIDPFSCTHFIYAFVGINANGTVRINDPWNEIGSGGLARFKNLKTLNVNAKTLIAIGGWSEGSVTFSNVAASPTLRANLIRSAVSFIQTHGFNGFDLDWEYPADRGGIPADKANFALLVKEFRAEFNKHGYLLTAAVRATIAGIAASYDVPSISRDLDFINVMTYDYHSASDGVTGQNAPLYRHSGEVTAPQNGYNVDSTIKDWISRGAPPAKLILGLPIYGHTFTLANPGNRGTGAPTTGNGVAGPYTQEAGMLGYNEVCEKQMVVGWTLRWFGEQQVPYMYSGNQWVSYEDIRSFTLKVQYAKKKLLGGLMVRWLDTDDFRGTCGKGKYPLLKTIKSTLLAP